MSALKLMRSRYHGTCRSCNEKFPKETFIAFNGVARHVGCTTLEEQVTMRGAQPALWLEYLQAEGLGPVAPPPVPAFAPLVPSGDLAPFLKAIEDLVAMAVADANATREDFKECFIKGMTRGEETKSWRSQGATNAPAAPDFEAHLDALPPIADDELLEALCPDAPVWICQKEEVTPPSPCATSTDQDQPAVTALDEWLK